MRKIEQRTLYLKKNRKLQSHLADVQRTKHARGEGCKPLVFPLAKRTQFASSSVTACGNLIAMFATDTH